MNNKIKLIIGIVVCVVVFVGAYLLYNNLSDKVDTNQLATTTTQSGETTTEKQLQLAPDFTVIDRDGKEVKLSDYKGKPIVLNFWASWCGPCKNEMPEFDKACKEYDGEIEFMMVNLTDGGRETIDSATQFIDSTGYTFPVYFDTNNSASSVYYTYSIPVTYFINADGYLVAQATGTLSADGLQQGIDMIKGE